jgi:nucleotide-binding universal stress UspA family protein
MFPDPTVFPDPKEFISEFILPSFRKILVTHDGKDKSNKAINYAIYLSKLSGAEITILQIINDVKKQDNVYNIEGDLIDSMEEKIKQIKHAGCEKVSYKFKTGNTIDEIVGEINEMNYDLVVLTSSHLNSWMESLFSNTRKIISNIHTSVLIPQ